MEIAFDQNEINVYLESKKWNRMCQVGINYKCLELVYKINSREA